MKKIMCVIISISLLISLGAVGVHAEEPQADIGFAVASDLHYNIPRTQIEGVIDDPIYWYANRRAAMEDESGFIIDEFLNQCAQDSTCEFVLISGDIVDNGRSIQSEHEDVVKKFKAFEQETGKQIYVINGNHDAAENSLTTFADFKRLYKDFGYDQALVVDEKSCSYTADLGEKYRLIALDSCDETASTEDGMSTEKLQWVHQQVKAAKEDGRYPILMMHHNLVDHLPLQRLTNRNFIVRFHYTTAELFADWGIRLVFTGHEHCSDAACYTSALGNKIYDFATTSLSMYPLQYRMISMTDEEIRYSAKTVDSIDTDALTAAVGGYSPEQAALMNAGFNSYAKGFLKAGIEYRLKKSLSPEDMEISPEAFYYDLVNKAVSGLTDILDMPLYGENSVQELAAEYDLVIPESGYKNAWDILTELVANHYAGEESLTLDSPEVTIFLRTAALILRTDPAAVSDEIFFKYANSLLADFGIASVSEELTKLGVSVFGAVTPAEYFILALASPLLYSFAYDDDGVNDNNGTLPGYAVKSVEGNAENIINNIDAMLSKVVYYINLILSYLLEIR